MVLSDGTVSRWQLKAATSWRRRRSTHSAMLEGFLSPASLANMITLFLVDLEFP
jgi:hypothetical protein